MGEERITALLQESLSIAVKSGAMTPADTRRVIVDTTVQPKNVMFPTDAKLIHRARERLVRLARQAGLDLRQTYVRVGKLALIKHQRLCARQAVQAGQQGAAQAEDLSRADHPRHLPPNRRRCGAGRDLQMAALPGIGGSGATPAPT
jgi:IS5 family transposase